MCDVDLETPAGSGSVPMSEWHTVRDKQLTADQCELGPDRADPALRPQRRPALGGLPFRPERKLPARAADGRHAHRGVDPGSDQTGSVRITVTGS